MLRGGEGRSANELKRDAISFGAMVVLALALILWAIF